MFSKPSASSHSPGQAAAPIHLQKPLKPQTMQQTVYQQPMQQQPVPQQWVTVQPAQVISAPTVFKQQWMNVQPAQMAQQQPMQQQQQQQQQQYMKVLPAQIKTAPAVYMQPNVPVQLAQQQQEQSYMPFSPFSRQTVSSGPERLFTDQENLQDKLVGVIVTIYEGSSYDENFRQVQPKAADGERVSTYSLQCCEVGKLHEFLTPDSGQEADTDAWRQLVADLGEVEPDSVTFNWECCSGCSDQGFPCGGQQVQSRSRRPGTRFVAAGTSPTILLASLAIKKGFTVMFSDFSLKALIKDWSEEHLGPNPFKKLQQEANHQFKLEFRADDLRGPEVPQQLQVVSELCGEQGHAFVGALGGTIMYTLDPRMDSMTNDDYTIKVLTVVTRVSGNDINEFMPPSMACSTGDGTSGAAGHVTLQYKDGRGKGQLVASMGHWIELSRLNTTEEATLETAARNFGMEYRAQLETDLSNYSGQERAACVQRWSKQMVQQSVPSQMQSRTKYSM